MIGATSGLRGLRFETVAEETGGLEAIQPRPVTQPNCLRLLPTEPIGPGDVAVVAQFPPEGVVDVVFCFHLSDGTKTYAELPRVARNRYVGLVHLPERLKSVALEVTGSGDPWGFREISLQPANALIRLRALTQRVIRIGSREIGRFIPSLRLAQWGLDSIQRHGDYRIWRDRFDERPDVDRDLHRDRALLLGEGPLISLVMYAGSEDHELGVTIASLIAQFYVRWELIVITAARVGESDQGLLQKAAVERRITVRAANGSRASAYNEALGLARGSFIAAIPPGAQLPAHALTEIAWAIEAHPHAEFLYTDEDRVDDNGRRYAPRFKPDWSPDYLRSRDYVGDLALYRTSTLRQVGGWRELSGVENYDAKLRLTNEVAAELGAVLHLPKVLIHVPCRPEVNVPTAVGFTVQVPSGHTGRQTQKATPREDLEQQPPLDERSDLQPTVSIIIPTRDQAGILSACVRSILERTDYSAYEIIIVDNASQEPETVRVFEELVQDERVRVLKYPYPFNYSAINNHAVRHSRGALLALLNNDVEAIAPTWLSDMAAHACRKEIGCVGAKLLYPDGTVQHGGILLGVAGLAGHAHRYTPGIDAGYLGRLQSVLNVSAVTAACLVVRREVFDEVGGLDEVGLATAFNDVDFCLKVRAAGYRNLWDPNAVLIHHESKSRGYERTPAKRARLAQEEDVMRRRWGRALLEDPYYSPCLTRASEDFRPRRI